MMQVSQKIKQFASGLGFDACGICEAGFVGEHAEFLERWLHEKKNAGMHFMENYLDKRMNPSLLMENAKSVVVVAMNYYPAQKRPEEYPQFSYYAYGKDYHKIVKKRLKKLLSFINEAVAPVNGRVFCDSAPVLEKYHAQKAGIGWIGKHTQLIIPGKGSYFFLGVLLLDIELPYDTPMEERCGSCMKCLQACPTKALEQPFRLNAGKCLPYLTIEHQGEIPPEYVSVMGNRIFGCDTCNQACPWNAHANPTNIEELTPSPEFLKLDDAILQDMTEADFKRIFNDSPVERVGYQGLMRNASLIRGAAGSRVR